MAQLRVRLEKRFRVRVNDLKAELERGTPGATLNHVQDVDNPHLVVLVSLDREPTPVCHIYLKKGTKPGEPLETLGHMHVIRNDFFDHRIVKERVIDALRKVHVPVEVALEERLKETQTMLVTPRIVTHASLQERLRRGFDDPGLTLNARTFEVHGRSCDDSLIAKIDLADGQPHHLKRNEVWTGGGIEAFRASHNGRPVSATVEKAIRKA